jgi:acyl-CoA thioesterase FadM
MVCKDTCTFGDQIEIETMLEKINKRSIAFKYIARNINTNRVVFEAETVNFVISKEGKLSSFPDYIYEKIVSFHKSSKS